VKQAGPGAFRIGRPALGILVCGYNHLAWLYSPTARNGATFPPSNGTTMKRINQGELFQHLGGFLKAKGIELREGSYTRRIQQGCALLSDTINLSQTGLEKAKTKAEQKLEELRQVIHEKTAPKSAGAPEAPPPPPTIPPASKAAPATRAKVPPRKGTTRRSAKARRSR
jgi:hypothetical protein